ncbi:MAG TPA: hypothetical protein VLB76_18765 [Thermoanaerobaculia bacterium]|jgi:hypothetical protein|nr:hypothetical protein [Thermoanaerobaculia bacterium]
MSTIIGLDIGQRRDPTAICVAETERRPAGTRQVYHFLVRHLERLALGTSYPAITQRLVQIEGQILQRTAQPPTLYVDATGVGQPVVDLLQDDLSRSRVIAVYFTYGDRRTEEENHSVTLGKAYLVSRLQTLLQTGRLHLPRTPESEILAQELLDYQIRVDEKANERYGDFKVGSHDDLVTAMGLAVQTEPRLTSGIR